jgi:hypothetical protein
MLSDHELRARLTALTIEVQPLYLAHPNRAAAIAQLERMADGAQDLMMGKAIPHEALDLLQQQLREFIAAVK